MSFAARSPMRRWPDHILAQRALGVYRYTVEEDYAGALELFQAVVAEIPNDIVAVVNIRNAYKRLDQREEFLYWSHRAVELSPESQVVANEHVLALLANRRLEEAMALAERAYTYLASRVKAQTTRGPFWKEFVLIAAQAAALAGYPDEANRLRALADEQEHAWVWLEARADVEKAFRDAYLGDPEAGWTRFEPWADDPYLFATRAYLRVAPNVQHLFGEVARFQEFIRTEDP